MLSVSIVSPYNAREATVATWTIGDATVTRLEEQVGFASLPPEKFLDGFDRDLLAWHLDWLVPHHYSPQDDRLITSIHSWLIRTGRHTILLDSCAGNHKSRPGFARFHQLDIPFLQRLRAAGVEPEEIDVVLCTHLHADHVGWNTRLKDGRWVPTFPNARYVFSKPDFDYFHKLDADPKDGPAELGTFRECVLPVVEAGRADLVTGPHRLNEHLEILPAPGHSPGHFFFKLESGGQQAAFIGDVFHHLLQVYYPHWNFPKNSDAEQARVSRRKVLELCASSGALTLPGHVGAPFAGAGGTIPR